MKYYLHVVTVWMLSVAYCCSADAQTVIWFENFANNPCDSLCSVNGYSGNGGNWTEAYINTQGNEANKWYISCAENGNAVGACGSGCDGKKNTLHVGNIKGSPKASLICPTGDCGAIYDYGGAGGINSTQTRKIAESPTINCTDYKNMTLSFNYMSNGEQGLDKFVLYWYNGTTWDSLITPPKTLTNSCPAPHYGTWTRYSIALPASANQNPNVGVGFLWQNNDDGIGSNPSVAIDSIELVGTFILPPIANYTPSQNNFCQNTCINFTDQSTNVPTSWSWSFGGGAIPNTSTAENPTNICFNTPGNYFVVLTATNTNGSDTAGMTIVVTACTLPKSVFSIPSPSICYGDCVSFANNSQNATSYSWNFGGSTTPNTSTAQSPDICFNSIGTFHIVLSATNSNGTDTSGLTVTVTDCLAPAFTATGTNECTNYCVSFTDQTTGNPTSWNWSFPGGTPSTSTQQNPANVCYPNVGVFDVSLSVSNGGGNNSITKTGYITVIQSPKGTISNDTSIKYGDSVKLFATGGVSYLWAPANELSDSAIANPVATPTITTTYTVSVIGANGCITMERVVITVIQPQLVFVPNTFTPNGDGKNDLFKIYTAEPVSTSDIKIFDRWGELLYETFDITKGWDGTYKGKPMTMGVYVYYYNIQLENGKNLTGKGDITLLR